MAIACDHFDNGTFEEEDDRVLERMMMFLSVQRTMNTIVVMMRTMLKPLGKKNRRVMLGRPK